MKARFPSMCRCGGRIRVGDDIVRRGGTFQHVVCHPARNGADRDVWEFMLGHGLVNRTTGEIRR